MKVHLTKIIKSMFGKHLLLTNVVISGGLMGVGDILVQNYDKAKGRAKSFDLNRTGRLTTVGVVCFGPLNHAWYTYLDYILPGRKYAVILKKTLLDQICAAPVFSFTFFMGTGLLEGQTALSSFNEFKSVFWDVYKADWSFWPAAQIINFVFVPAKLRVLYVSAATLIWNVYLDYKKHEEKSENVSNVSASSK